MLRRVKFKFSSMIILSKNSLIIKKNNIQKFESLENNTKKVINS